MAYVQETDPTAAPQAEQQGTDISDTGPQTASGGGSNTAATSGSPQGASSVSSAAKAPPVQDLHAYLAANAPQAVQAGQKIGNNLSSVADKVTGDINTDQNAFGQQVQAQNTAPNTDLVDQAALNPSAFVQDPNNLRAFLKQRDARYTGPASYEQSGNYQGLQNEVTNAVSNAPDINKPGGITQLVTGQEKNPTIGKQNLDSLLLQENQDALSPIKSALAKYPGLQGQLTGAGGTQNAAIQNAIANDQASAQNVQDRFLTGQNAAVPAWEKSLQDELSQAQTGTTNYNAAAQKQIQDYSSLFPIINSYESANPSFNLEAPPTLQQPQTGAPTLQSVATQKDYDTQKALSQLLGSGLGVTPIDQSTAGQAGTYQTPQFNPLDIQGYLNPLVENATGQVATRAAQNNPSWDPNGDNSSNNIQNESVGLLDQLAGHTSKAPDITSFENFLNQLAGTNYRPTSLTNAADDQELKNYLASGQKRLNGFDLTNKYTVQ